MINRQECICLMQDSKRILLQNKKAARVLPYFLDGAIDGNRTRDPRDHNPML